MRTSLSRLFSRRLSAKVAAATVFAAALVPSSARADDIEVPFGAKRQLVLGELAGLRLSPSGTSFAGPLGFSLGKVSTTDFGNRGEATTSYTTFWLAPSADIFVIDHLSVGGLIDIEHTSSSRKVPLNNNATAEVDLPGVTTFQFNARVGWMFPIGQRFGVWPRLGLGYHTTQYLLNTDAPNAAVKETFSGFLLGLDVNGMWRATEQAYFVLAPEFVFSPGGSHSARVGGAELSANASAFQFAIRTGFGVLFDL